MMLIALQWSELVSRVTNTGITTEGAGMADEIEGGVPVRW